MKEQVSVDKEFYDKLISIKLEYEMCIDVTKYCTILIENYNKLVDERDRLKRLDENVKQMIADFKAELEEMYPDGDIPSWSKANRVLKLLESLDK